MRAGVLRPSLEETLKKYQNPAEADKLMAIQKDLDETKAIMHDTIDAALERCVFRSPLPFECARGAGNETGAGRANSRCADDLISRARDRGVKLDELIEKSDDLSASSKMFYTTAKKHNQCCDIM